MDNFTSSDVELMDSTTPGVDISSYVEYPEYKLAVTIWQVSPPCIILLGGFGNIATVFVMRRIKDHNSSPQHAILTALAASDIILLGSATVHGWTKFGLQVDIRSSHTVVCKLLTWVIYVSGSVSAWLVTCVTVQRTMAVLWPHRMRGMCTVRRTWIVVASLVLGACALDFHFLVGMKLSQSHGCDATPGAYKDFFHFVFSWVDSCLVSIFPTVCLFVCDIILSATLIRAVSSASSIAARTESNVANARNTDSRKKMSYRTTVMVLAISCAFLVLTTPICVFAIWVGVMYVYMAQHPQRLAMVVFLQALTYQLWYLNSAINFFLYCLTGTKFRREFVSWIRCCGAQSPSAPSVQETASEASRGGRHKHPGNSPLSK